jgi:hypothetical protein
MYSSPGVITVIKFRETRWKGYIVRMKEIRSAYRIFVGKLEIIQLVRRSRRRWEGDIKIDVTEIGCDCMDLINMA